MSLEKHALHRGWKLWYDSPSTYNTNWELSLVPIVTVQSVEDFFAMLHFMKPVHSVRTFAQLHFFQEGVKPMWEDSANKDGGKLWFNVDVDSKADMEKPMDDLWESILMALVGEVLEDPQSDENDVMGVVLSKKKNYNRVAIWVRDAGKTDAVERIKKGLSEFLPSSYKLTFTKHGEKQ
eukprot:gene8396-5878_t